MKEATPTFFQRGPFRLWAALCLLWLVGCAYAGFTSHKEWLDGLELGQVDDGLLESERRLFVQDFVSDAKAVHDDYIKKGFLPPSLFDEKWAQVEGQRRALLAAQHSDTRQDRDAAYAQAFSARDRFYTTIKLAPLFPLASAALFGLVAWVAQGFKNGKSSRYGA